MEASALKLSNEKNAKLVRERIKELEQARADEFSLKLNANIKAARDQYPGLMETVKNEEN